MIITSLPHVFKVHGNDLAICDDCESERGVSNERGKKDMKN